MADEFLMPKLGLTMEAGTIVSWLVEDGTEVQPGQPVLVIETDKVESEVEATAGGAFHHLGQVGEEYPCGAHIGWLLAPGEAVPVAPAAAGVSSSATAATSAGRAVAAGSAAVPAVAGASAASSAAIASGAAPGGPVAGVAAPVQARAATGVGGRLLASPNARRLAAARGVDLWSVAGTGPGGRITSEDVPEQPVAANGASAPAPVASPGVALGVGGAPATIAARQLADLLGVDVRIVAAAGPDPRVTRDDVALHVRALLAGPAAPPPLAPAAPPAPAAPRSGTAVERPLPAASQEPSSVIPLRGMRGTIADRMSRSLHGMAQLTLTMDVDMDAVVADRTARKTAAADDGVVPGFTDYVIAAVASALVEHPLVNSQITDDGVALLPQVNVGLAVALDDGLIVPVVTDTPTLALEELAAETARLAEAARGSSLELAELQGGTFSVTALGMFDVDAFTPIINAPNTAILGVGRLRDDVSWTDDGEPQRTSRLTLSLTWDHRAFDGAPAAQFTRTVKAKLEAVDGAGR